MDPHALELLARAHRNDLEAEAMRHGRAAALRLPRKRALDRLGRLLRRPTGT